MIIYESEKKLGIDLSNNSIAYTVNLLPEDKTKQIDKQKAVAGYFDELKQNQSDIYWYESVLASVGKNLNDDIFTKEDLWNAKSTPVNKPVNYMHDNDDIIGHMVASLPVDFDGNTIDSSTAFENVPNEFEIVTASVLYKVWEDEQKAQRMLAILQDIPSNKWKVSMECRFSDFDYGLTNQATGENIIVKRDESTAFLTQFLRIHGGKGEWKGYKVGRVIRNFYFSAKGLVTDPANERSLIREAGFANANIKTVNDIKENNTMSDKQEELRVIDADTVLAEVKSAHASQLESATKMLEAAEAKHETEIQKLQAELEEAVAKSEEMDTQKDKYKKEADAELAEAVKAKEDAEAKVAELEKSVSELEASVKTLESEKQTAERLSKLAKANVVGEDADKLIKVWATATDEQFDSVVAAYEGKTKKEDEEEDAEGSFNFDSEEMESEAGLTTPAKLDSDDKYKDLLSSVSKAFSEIDKETK